MKLLIFAILAALCCPASARIGETPRQLVKRYGPATPGNTKDELQFSKNGIFVRATIWKGRCHTICFGTRPPTAIGMVLGLLDAKPAPPLTEEQMRQLLALNAPGKWLCWKTEPNGRELWESADQKVSADWNDGVLIIATYEIIQGKAAEKAAAAAKTTTGF